jgi:excisionase family DNA binding protein
VIIVDRVAEQHLARAVDSYVVGLRRNGIAVPPELAALVAAFTASSRLQPTGRAEDHDDDDAGRMPLLLDYDEVGQLLGVSDRTVQRLVADGALPSVTIGRSRRVRPEDLREYVNELPNSTREDKIND